MSTAELLLAAFCVVCGFMFGFGLAVSSRPRRRDTLFPPAPTWTYKTRT